MAGRDRAEPWGGAPGQREGGRWRAWSRPRGRPVRAAAQVSRQLASGSGGQETPVPDRAAAEERKEREKERQRGERVSFYS